MSGPSRYRDDLGAARERLALLEDAHDDREIRAHRILLEARRDQLRTAFAERRSWATRVLLASGLLGVFSLKMASTARVTHVDWTFFLFLLGLSSALVVLALLLHGWRRLARAERDLVRFEGAPREAERKVRVEPSDLGEVQARIAELEAEEQGPDRAKEDAHAR